jgi:hypothetical protein
MPKKILLPVFPSDRFYEAVVRAADIVADEGGGLITFAFTRVRPSQEEYEKAGDGQAGEIDVEVEAGNFDARDLEKWREKQISGLDEARRLLYDRGVTDGQIDYLFADEADAEGAAQALADEAAAGAYDMVVLARGYFEDEVNDEESTPGEVAEAVQALDDVKLVVA